MILKRNLPALFLSCLLLASATLASGQQQNNYRVNLVNEVKQLCTLTPAQVIKVQPIIKSFEKSRDSIYSIYHNAPNTLKMEVNQNKWHYETNLIGVITPYQMGLLKAFDQSNPDLMTYNSSHVVSVMYLADAK
jgi:hypothetical protein